MFENLIEILKANPRKIVYTEGADARILSAAARLKKDGFLTPVLVGNVEEVKAAAKKGGFDIEGLAILDPATYPGMDEMVEKMVELRKGKMTADECRAALSKGNYFGTMLVKMGAADALLGGATYSTADTVRPALQLVKTKKGDLDKTADDAIIVDIGAVKERGIVKIFLRHRDHLLFTKCILDIAEDGVEVNPLDKDEDLRQTGDIIGGCFSDVFHGYQGFSAESSWNRGILVR